MAVILPRERGRVAPAPANRAVRKSSSSAVSRVWNYSVGHMLRMGVSAALGRALRLPGQMAFGTAVLGLSAARLTTTAVRSSADVGWAVGRAAGAAAIGVGSNALVGAG